MLLPQPDGPMNAVTDRAGISSVMSKSVLPHIQKFMHERRSFQAQGQRSVVALQGWTGQHGVGECNHNRLRVGSRAPSPAGVSMFIRSMKFAKRRC